ncbi:hypothetical protein KQI63_13835 [bacterium]|nr:hypothetical protein [bacterium]
MRYHFTSIILACFLAGSTSISRGAPWQSAESIEIGPLNRDSDGWLSVSPLVNNEYENRFGHFIDFMIWTDTDTPKNLTWFVNMSQDTSTIASWNEMIDYLYVELQEVNTDSLYFIELKESYINWEEGPSLTYNGKIEYVFNLSLDALPIPESSTTYHLRLQVWLEAPPDGELVYSVKEGPFVARGVRSTPIDSLMWAKDNRLLERDRVLCRKLLVHFPNNRAILQSLYFESMENQKCDSLLFYADRLLKSYKHQLDSYYLDLDMFSQKESPSSQGPPPLAPEQYNRIISQVWDACGDTTGLTQYAP